MSIFTFCFQSTHIQLLAYSGRVIANANFFNFLRVTDVFIITGLNWKQGRSSYHPDMTSKAGK